MKGGVKETVFQAKLAPIKKMGIRTVKHFIEGEQCRNPLAVVLSLWLLLALCCWWFCLAG